jgi:uncharacterized protein YfaS (alpha-2-macroglobulin family)
MAIYRSNGDKNKVRRLIEGALEKRFHEDMSAIFHSDTRSLAIVVLAVCTVDQNHKALPSLVGELLKKRQQWCWGNTQENSFALLALNAALKSGSSSNARLYINDQIKAENMLQGGDLPWKITIPAKDLGLLKIERVGSGGLYYHLRMLCRVDQTLQGGQENGFTLIKSYQSFNEEEPSDRFKTKDLIKVTMRLFVPERRHHVIIDDPLPAGFEAVHKKFVTNEKSVANFYRDESSPFSHVEMWDDRVLIFAEGLEAGEYEYSFVVRATSAGTFMVPGAKVEAMYLPHFMARTEFQKITID